MSAKTTADEIRQVCSEVADMLVRKNAAYGDSALSPLRVFSKADAIEAILVRIDDKLSRLARGDGSGDEDAEEDLLGYLVLLRIARRRAALDKEIGDLITNNLALGMMAAIAAIPDEPPIAVPSHAADPGEDAVHF